MGPEAELPSSMPASGITRDGIVSTASEIRGRRENGSVRRAVRTREGVRMDFVGTCFWPVARSQSVTIQRYLQFMETALESICKSRQGIGAEEGRGGGSVVVSRMTGGEVWNDEGNPGTKKAMVVHGEAAPIQRYPRCT